MKSMRNYRGKWAGAVIVITVLMGMVVPMNSAVAAMTQSWVQRYNGEANGEDKAIAITTDAGGNVYVTGQSTNAGGNLDYLTLKYDS